MEKRIERINKIINTLRIAGGATIRELATKLNVSEMTIRRDLSLLARDNLVKLIHGGAIFNPDRVIADSENGYYLPAEEQRQVEEKIRIGRQAASLIEPHDIIVIDNGSTTEQLAKCISPTTPLTVICFALNVLVEVHRHKDCRLVFSGGYFHEQTLMFESPEGVELIKRNRANKAFLAAGGVSDKLGLTTAYHYEVETKRAVMDSSQMRILLADSSKFGNIKAAYFADLKDFDMVITDAGIGKEYVDIIRELGLTLHLV